MIPSLKTTSEGKATQTDIIASKLTYALYADEGTWDNWQFWVSSNLKKTATPAQKDARLKFNGYVVELVCTVAGITDHIGCCLEDLSGGNGGVCLLQSESGAKMDTYRLNWALMVEYTAGDDAGN